MPGYNVGYPEDPQQVPIIIKDYQGTGSWQQAKKLLRKWYLDKAKELRKLDKRSYFHE